MGLVAQRNSSEHIELSVRILPFDWQVYSRLCHILPQMLQAPFSINAHIAQLFYLCQALTEATPYEVYVSRPILFKWSFYIT